MTAACSTLSRIWQGHNLFQAHITTNAWCLGLHRDQAYHAFKLFYTKQGTMQTLYQAKRRWSQGSSCKRSSPKSAALLSFLMLIWLNLAQGLLAHAATDAAQQVQGLVQADLGFSLHDS